MCKYVRKWEEVFVFSHVLLVPWLENSARNRFRLFCFIPIEYLG